MSKQELQNAQEAVEKEKTDLVQHDSDAALLHENRVLQTVESAAGQGEEPAEKIADKDKTQKSTSENQKEPAKQAAVKTSAAAPAQETGKAALPANKTAKPATKKMAESGVEDAEKPAVKKPTKPATKKAVESGAESAAKLVAKKTTKPAAKKAIEPDAEDAVKPAAKKTIRKTTKPAAEKPVEPAAKDAAKPETKKPAKPAVKKQTGPAEKSTELTVKKAEQPKAQSATEKKKKPVAKKPKQPVAKEPVKTRVQKAAEPVIPAIKAKTESADENRAEPIVEIAKKKEQAIAPKEEKATAEKQSETVAEKATKPVAQETAKPIVRQVKETKPEMENSFDLFAQQELPDVVEVMMPAPWKKETVQHKAAQIRTQLKQSEALEQPEQFNLFDGDPHEDRHVSARRSQSKTHGAVRRKRTGRGKWFVSTLAVLSVAILIFVVALGEQIWPVAATLPAESTSVADTNNEANSIIVEEYTNAPRDPELWSLLLANTDNALPEGYTPTLASVGSNARNGEQFVDERIAKAYWEMYEAAKKDGVFLIARSAYRSTQEQSVLFNSMLQQNLVTMDYAQAYAATKQWRNEPGTSEHETGLAIDIVGEGYVQAALTASLADTDWAKWLEENAADYGFILRYQKDKTDITGTGFEPWHYRYVGVEDAQKIMELGVCLEEYLGVVSDEIAIQMAQEKE